MKIPVRLSRPPAARFFGKYRGICLNNIDPLLRTRVKAQVPDVLGLTESNWAEPCLPFTSGGIAAAKAPPPGTPLWIEFEGGDPALPIWSGVRN